MNLLMKAAGTVLVLAAGTLGTSLTDLDPGFLPPLPSRPASEGASGNETGNQTSSGNSTTGSPPAGNSTGNATGNQTGGGAKGNQTGNATGNQTAGGNATAGNETAEPEEEPSSVCSFAVDDWGGDLMPGHDEWEWLITRDVTHLTVEFHSYGGVPLGGGSEARLVDGTGRTVARTSGVDGGISVSLERGTDYMANGLWRLTYDSDDLLSDYSVSIHVGCAE